MWLDQLSLKNKEELANKNVGQAVCGDGSERTDLLNTRVRLTKVCVRVINHTRGLTMTSM
jgi:hypothetical protein